MFLAEPDKANDIKNEIGKDLTYVPVQYEERGSRLLFPSM